MNALQTFQHEQFGTVRMLEIDGSPWFVGKDVSAALGYKDTDQALRKHVDDEDKLTRQFDGSGQKRDMLILNESGLYSLVLSSKLPAAKVFKRWVTNEVLPSIRKTGSYSTGVAPAQDGSAQLAKALSGSVRQLTTCVTKLSARVEELEQKGQNAPVLLPATLPPTREKMPGRNTLSPKALALLIALEHLSEAQEGEIQIENWELTRLMNVKSRQTMFNARKELIQAGYITYSPGVKCRPNAYQIHRV